MAGVCPGITSRSRSRRQGGREGAAVGRVEAVEEVGGHEEETRRRAVAGGRAEVVPRWERAREPRRPRAGQSDPAAVSISSPPVSYTMAPIGERTETCASTSAASRADDGGRSPGQAPRCRRSAGSGTAGRCGAVAQTLAGVPSV